jgi:UDP-N-acetylmuramoyl-L-alanyl-D-glutamate--2,6-diaminopimelate ligase
MLLKDALNQIAGIRWRGNPDADMLGISYDSRSVQQGDLFVAIRGEKTDGALYVAQAIKNGAAAVAAEQEIDTGSQAAFILVPDARRFLAEISQIFYGNPSAKLKLVGITGTKGKTTTSYMMEAIYKSAGFRSCLGGTIERKIGHKSFHSSHTTPESSDLLKFLNQAVTEGCTHGALEVSSISLVLKRVWATRFTVGVFTNLTLDHLDFHRDMETYFRAKQILFTAEHGNGVEAAVINIDDGFGKRLADAINIPTLRFGFDSSAKIRVLEYRSRTDGSDLELETPAGKIRFNMHLIGRPNVYNTMAATGAALSLGISLESIRKGIEAMTGVPGRMELIKEGQDYTVIVDYAHSPDSLDNLLITVSQLPHKRIITIFGCGGDRDRTKRPVMGEIAAKKSDFVIATSDNPRSEDPLAILEEIEPGLRKGSAPYKIIPDRREAIASAIAMAKSGDAVVIAGKGHEDYQIIDKQVIPFDDRKLAAELIRSRENTARQQTN